MAQQINRLHSAVARSLAVWHDMIRTQDLGAPSVGDKLLKGADFVRFDEDGKIIELEVMIRPLDALQALGQETRKRLGHKLADHKVSL